MLDNPYSSKRKYFYDGNTKSYEFRVSNLKNLKGAIEKYEDDIIKADRKSTRLNSSH